MLVGAAAGGRLAAAAGSGASVRREMLEQRLAGNAAERAARAAHRRALKARKAAVLANERAAQARHRAAADRRAALARSYTLPVSGYHLTARFNAGGGLWAHRHTGLDFAAAVGTPVKSVARGRIVDAGWADAYGYRLIVRHPDGTETWYCHLSGFVRTSGSVAVGTVIGRIGTTGNTTGPHLHLEVHPGGGGPVDPYTWLARRGHRP